jgi:hypothetical protein
VKFSLSDREVSFPFQPNQSMKRAEIKQELNSTTQALS